jgi:hypothetical protein
VPTILKPILWYGFSFRYSGIKFDLREAREDDHMI